MPDPSEDVLDGLDKLPPRPGTLYQFLAALFGELVDLACRPGGLRLPSADNEAIMLEGSQGWIQRAFSKLQSVLAAPLDLTGKSVAVQGSVQQDGQEQRGRVAFYEFSVFILSSLCHAHIIHHNLMYVKLSCI